MRAAGKKRQNEEQSGAPPSRSAERVLASRHNGVNAVEADDLLQEIESLRRRLSTLSETSGRVSENLDLNVVLQEVIESARSLTGARYGALLTYEQSGGIRDFITSGLSPKEIEHLKTLP